MTSNRVVDVSAKSVMLEKLYHSGIVPANCVPCNQYKQVRIQGLLIKLESGNNCIGLGEDVVIVSNIISVVDDVLVCKKFRHIENFFDYPLESKLLGVLRVHELRDEECLISVELFKCKYALLPQGSKYVAIPLAHNANQLQ